MRTSAKPVQRTVLKTEGVDPALKLEDIAKRGSLLAELAVSVSGLLKRFGVSARSEISARFAKAVNQGARPYQEDAVFVTDLNNSNTILAVLADGMGGHAAGDIASKIVIDIAGKEMIAALAGEINNDIIKDAMVAAIETCNARIAKHMEIHPETHGMGTTVVIAVIHENHLLWASIGDSPLYLWRNSKCYQINQDHSMAPQIDQMAKVGLISIEDALKHPDRNCLTSALTGEPPTFIDAGNEPLELLKDDVILLSSDGLQYLTDKQIADIIRKQRKAEVDQITRHLMTSVLDLGDPEQDNIGVIAIKLEKANASTTAAPNGSAPKPAQDQAA